MSTVLPALPAFLAALPADQAGLLARLHAFALLPSWHWHPARAPWQDEQQALGALAQQPALARALHRRWSQQLLAGFSAEPAGLADLSHPALPLALAPPELMQRCARLGGALLLGPGLRRVVLRAPVLALRAALGAETLHWICREGMALHPGLDGFQAWLPEAPQGLDAAEAAGWLHAADRLGAGLLAQAWQDAPAGLRQRADGKLPPSADDPAVRAASGLPPAGARALCLQLLTRLEPIWLSSFPATP